MPDVSDDERRRLEWAGIRTVAQLRSVQARGGEEAIRRVSNLPVDRLRAALSRATEPRITDIAPDAARRGGRTVDGSLVAKIRGGNFTAFEGHPPVVRVDGERIPVIDANDRELVVHAPAHRLRGTLEIETGPGMSVSHALVLADGAPSEEAGTDIALDQEQP
jgi:hypothetical protein